MRRFSWLLLPFTFLSACGSSSSTSSTTPPPSQQQGGAGAASDVCAGDSWLPQLLGERPTISNVMKLEGMRRARLFAPGFAKLETVQMDYLYEFSNIRSASVESYQWRTAQPNTSDAKLMVVRQAFGDPRALKEDSTFLYGNPTPLANGILEYPPSPDAATKDISFRPRGGRGLYTFPDGTWVRVDAWMMQRVRNAFAAGPPPLPPSGPDVAWEVCGTINELLRSDYSTVWGVRPERGALRFFAGRDPMDAEMVFRFQSPALAIRAEGEQRVRCSQPPVPGKDKGLFSLVPQCSGIIAATVEGPLLRYTYHLTSAQ